MSIIISVYFKIYNSGLEVETHGEQHLCWNYICDIS